LILKGNHIKQIPSNAIQFTTRSLSHIGSNEQSSSALEVIDLSENPIESIDANSFNALGHIRELYLDSCLINTIDIQAFSGIPSIKILSLTNNALSEVPSEAIASLTTLKILKLDSNNIQTIRRYAFKNLFSLEELYMNNGPLTEIETYALSGLKSVKILELNHNPNLTTIQSSIFEDLPKLTHLSIRMSSLTTLIAIENIDKHPLVVVDLRGNSLTCNCDLKWLTNSLNKLNDTAISIQNKTKDNFLESSPGDIISDPTSLGELLNITCAAPAALVGKRIISLPNKKLECLQPDSSLNVHIGFASLFCMILILTSVCLINFCRNEKHLMGILKENIVQNRISMMLPYSQDTQETTDEYSKETQLECAEYEPIDYGQYYSPIYTLPLDHCINESFDQRQTQQL
jgi:Leucine-rich repeat (LRR) protein